MTPLEIALSIIGVVVPIVGSILVGIWKVSQWVERITQLLNAINQRLEDGSDRMERIEAGQDELRDRVKTLEVEHRRGCALASRHGEE